MKKTELTVADRIDIRKKLREINKAVSPAHARHLIGNVANMKNARRSTIILMAIPDPIHSVIATLDMPSAFLKRVERAEKIITKSDESTWVAVDPAVITALTTKKNAYKTAPANQKEAKYKVLNNGLKAMMGDFQTAADEDPENSVAIIESGGFGVKHVTPRQQQQFKVDYGTESGTVVLTAKGGGDKAHLHEWRFSANGLVWVLLRSTNAATKLVVDLEVGKYAYFTHELIIQDVPQGRSQVIEIMVK